MPRGKVGAREQRPHLPHQLGPRVFKRGRYYACDLRPWGGGQPTLRNPRAVGWPAKGERTDDEELARRWAWRYVDRYREQAKREALGIAEPDELLIGDAVRRYLEASERVRVAARTLEGRTTVLGHLEEYFTPDVDVHRIQRGDVQAFFDQFMDDGYAESTLRTMHRIVSGFFSHLFPEGPNPARGVRLPDVPQDDVRDWTDAEVEEIRTAADKVQAQRKGLPDARRAIEYALASGLRQQELFALDHAAIHPDEYTARVSRQLNRAGTSLERLKGKRARTTLLLPSFWDWYQPGEGLLLPGPNGPLGAHPSFDLLQRILDTAGVNERGAGWHRFRHTYARWFLEAGGSLEELRTSLGHSSIRTTERSYDHFRPRRAAQTARERIYAASGARLRVV